MKTLYKTYNYPEHKPCGFMLHLVNAVDNTTHELLHRGADAISVFCNKHSEIRDGTKERMQENGEIDMTDEDRENKSEIRGIAPSSYPSQKI